MFFMLVSPNPLPYSSVRVWEANFKTCSPYFARSFPFCSCVTIRQPISQLRTTNSVMFVNAIIIT